jgi:hypothetical protein
MIMVAVRLELVDNATRQAVLAIRFAADAWQVTRDDSQMFQTAEHGGTWVSDGKDTELKSGPNVVARLDSFVPSTAKVRDTGSGSIGPMSHFAWTVTHVL